MRAADIILKSVRELQKESKTTVREISEGGDRHTHRHRKLKEEFLTLSQFPEYVTQEKKEKNDSFFI